MKDKYSFLNIPCGVIRLSIADRCNMECYYCHNEGQPKNTNPDMTYPQFLKIIDISKEFGLRGISFSGGEPLLNKDFEKMLRYVVSLNLHKIDVCTNGILLDKFINILKISEHISLAIGIDTCRSDMISKQSKIGMKFSEISKTLELLKNEGIKFNINTVYTIKNKREVIEIIDYCKNNNYGLRVIEMDTFKKISNGNISEDFNEFISEVKRRYKLNLAFFHPGKGYYSKHDGGPDIYFYQAKCHTRDCLNCARCHFRIDTAGNALPCYSREMKIPILCRDSKKARENFLLAMHNLGISPEEIKEEKND